jgi:hypothetical protein
VSSSKPMGPIPRVIASWRNRDQIDGVGAENRTIGHLSGSLGSVLCLTLLRTLCARLGARASVGVMGAQVDNEKKRTCTAKPG